MPYPKTPPELLAAIHNYASDDEDLMAALAPACEKKVPMEAIYAAYDCLSTYPDADGFDPAQLDVAAQRILSGASWLIQNFNLSDRAKDGAALTVFMEVTALLPEVLNRE